MPKADETDFRALASAALAAGPKPLKTNDGSLYMGYSAEVDGRKYTVDANLLRAAVFGGETNPKVAEQWLATRFADMTIMEQLDG